MRQIQKGWLFRDAQSIIVQIHGAEEKRFDLGRDGETAARNHVTKVLDRDDWTLGDMAFLGYRIQVPAKEELPKPPREWTDLKSCDVACQIKRLRPKWYCEPENFNGLIMIDVPVGDRELRLVVGNSNETLGADVYLSLDDLETGDIQDESIDTGVNADEESVQMIAGALIGAIETYMTYVVPTLLDRKEMIVDEPKV